MAEWQLAGETEIREDNLLQFPILRLDLVSNQGRRCGKQSTNHLSYDTARHITRILVLTKGFNCEHAFVESTWRNQLRWSRKVVTGFEDEISREIGGYIVTWTLECTVRIKTVFRETVIVYASNCSLNANQNRTRSEMLHSQVRETFGAAWR
jgi:hypothetical protein